MELPAHQPHIKTSCKHGWLEWSINWLVICALMECDIRNRIWAAWHLLHFQLNNSLKLQELLLTCYSRSLRALVTSLLWADPWHISASSTGTGAGNCLLARRNGSHTQTWVQNKGLQHQFRNPEKNPNILPSVSLLVHSKIWHTKLHASKPIYTFWKGCCL